MRGFFNTRIGIQIKHTVGLEDEINYLGSSCLPSCKGIMVLVMVRGSEHPGTLWIFV